MVETISQALALGAPAAPFTLPAPGGGPVSLADFAGRPLLVAFLCNHCPFVRHIAPALGRLTSEAMACGLGAVGINPNDAARAPDDAPERMPAFARAMGLAFPYLHDADQAVARAYHAVCTPELFVFDRGHALAYHGQFDASRPGSDVPVTGGSLRAAIDAILAGRPVPEPQPASVGCSIKWRAA